MKQLQIYQCDNWSEGHVFVWNGVGKVECPFCKIDALETEIVGLKKALADTGCMCDLDIDECPVHEG